MGKIVTIEYVDDLDGVEIDADVVDTVEFSYRGQDYSLVLTTKNGAQFDKDMARYITAAKKAQTRDARAARKKARPEPRQSAKPKAATPRKAASRKAAAAAPSGPDHVRAVREWAVANGHNVSRRGRIPASIMDAYNAAH
ncbi:MULTISPECIES: histone-like nucleoid-structuring protein Lsr2 [unclassified Mycolicibacterium]|uniref:histone-like nucleoid-structuring protein Lsr2 n=1 Tax=unclassified Mycolicibacterium TaxID=2636767 RepID=UPI002EDAE7A1